MMSNTRLSEVKQFRLYRNTSGNSFMFSSSLENGRKGNPISNSSATMRLNQDMIFYVLEIVEETAFHYGKHITINWDLKILTKHGAYWILPGSASGFTEIA